LLILAGEVVFADRPPNAVEGFERLAVGVQGLTLTAPEPSRSPDRLDFMDFVGFGDRRKAQHLPGLLRKDVADKVVFVQPLHDDDDGTTALVVEAAVERVVVPLVGGLPLRGGERLCRAFCFKIAIIVVCKQLPPVPLTTADRNHSLPPTTHETKEHQRNGHFAIRFRNSTISLQL
jgi:hypothetical protein